MAWSWSDLNAVQNPSAGATILSAWGDQVRTNQVAELGRPRVRVRRTTNQSINDSTATNVTFDSELTDSHAAHDTGSNTDRITIPTGCDGFWIIGASVGWAANTTGRRYAHIDLNGAAAIVEDECAPNAVSGGCIQNLTAGWYATAGDYFTVQVYQTSGGALNVPSATYLPSFWAVMVTGTVVG